MRLRSFVGVGLACAVVLVAGCQGEDAFSFVPPGLAANKAESAKSPLQDTCLDLRNDSAFVRTLLKAVNDHRAKHHLRPLRLDTTLTQAAEFWSCRMIEGGFFGHEDPHDGSKADARALNFGYAFRKIGENLAAGQESVREVMTHWMQSPGHRANLLDPAFVDIGIGIKQGGEYGVYWVLELGRPITASPLSTDGGSAESSESTSPGQQPASQPTSGDRADVSMTGDDGDRHPAAMGGAFLFSESVDPAFIEID